MQAFQLLMVFNFIVLFLFVTHFYLTLLQSAKDIRYLELALEESEECLGVRNTHIAHVFILNGLNQEVSRN